MANRAKSWHTPSRATRTWSTRVETVVLTGANGTTQISGDDFRFLYGLRSTWFDLG